jgi:hypothetical protein
LNKRCQPGHLYVVDPWAGEFKWLTSHCGFLNDFLISLVCEFHFQAKRYSPASYFRTIVFLDDLAVIPCRIK